MNGQRESRIASAAKFLLPALLLALGAGAAAAAPAADLPGAAAREALLLEVRLGRSVLSPGISVYADGPRFYLPLGELCRLLELAVDVDASRGVAAGFLIDEKKAFKLDAKFRRVSAGDREASFGEDGAFIEDGDLYLEKSLLEAWLPVALEVAFNDLMLRVVPREKLPLEARLERAARIASSRAAAPPADLPRLDLPYRLADGAFLDASMRYSRRQGGAGGEAEQSLEYSLAATGELLFLEASLYLYGDDSGPLDARLQLGRKDPEGRLLGPLRAREVALGEVFHPGLELVARPSSGPGFLISSFPLDQPGLFGRESFRGELPAGWEAELYRGDELLAFAGSRPGGLYEFLEVPLLFGLNLFRIELYGPQGQRRTERYLRNVGDSLIAPGKVHYRLAGGDPGSGLFGGQPASGRRAEAGERLSLQLAAGLAHRLSATASLAAVEHHGRRSSFAQAGLRAFRGPFLASLDVAAAAAGGSAVQGSLQSRWRGLRFELQHAAVDGLPSEVFFASGEELRGRSRLRLDTVLPAAWVLPRLPLFVDLRHDRFASGRQQDDLTLRLAGFARGFAVTHQLSLSRSSGGGLPRPAKNAAGLLLVSKYLPALALRGEADYQLEPRAELTTLSFSAEWRRPGNYLLSAGVYRAFLSGENRFQIGVSRLEGVLGFTAAADYGATGGFGLSLLLSSSFGRDADGGWHRQARPLAFTGGLLGRVFLDRNGNGGFDPGEQTVSGAGLRVGGADTAQRTGDDGRLFLANLPPHQAISVELAAESLEDPYWQPAKEGVSVVPRPGKVVAVDLPVQVSGEISGTVYLQREGGAREAGGIELELVGPGNQVVARTRSAGDGFYLLDKLRPGRYWLRISAEQTSRLGLGGKIRREVELAAGGTVLDNLDFRLTRASG